MNSVHSEEFITVFVENHHDLDILDSHFIVEDSSRTCVRNIKVNYEVNLPKIEV